MLQLFFTAKARRKTFRTELQSARKASSKEIKSGAYKIPLDLLPEKTVFQG